MKCKLHSIRLQQIIPLLCWIAAACSIPKIPMEDNAIPMPTAFQISTDTLNSVSDGWRSFFTSTPLRRLLDSVIANNPDMAIATQRIQASRALLVRSSGALMPSVDAAIQPSLRKFGTYTMDGAGNKTTEIESGRYVPVHLPDIYLGLQASWEVDVWGKLKNQKQAALARYLASNEGRNLIQTGLVAETATAYYELVCADHQLNLLDQTIKLQEQAVEMVKVQKQAAVVNELAVQQFEAQVLELRGMREEVLQGIDMLENRIHLLAGRFSGSVKRDTVKFVAEPPPVVYSGVPAALLRNRPDIRQAEWELQATRSDVKAARAAYFPSFQITGNIGLQAYKAGLLIAFPESLAYGLFAGMMGPILNKSSVKSEFARASAIQQEALFNYKKTILQGFSEVQLELNRLQRMERSFDLKQKETNLLASSTIISDALFRTGRAAYLEVLIARQNALRSNMELINMRKNQYLSAVLLFRALGGGYD